MSSKDTFEPHHFGANTFAVGTFRGLGAEAAPPKYPSGTVFDRGGFNSTLSRGGGGSLLDRGGLASVFDRGSAPNA